MKVKLCRNFAEIYAVMLCCKDDMFDNAISKDKLYELASKYEKNGIFILAKEHGNITGYAAIYCNDKDGRTAFLSTIVIRKAYQGKGIGRSLIEEAVKYSKQSEMKKLRLQVSAKNEKAIRFYKKIGFSIISTDVATNSHYMEFAFLSGCDYSNN